MPEEEKPEPKISTPEAILVIMVLMLADGIELLLLFLALDDFWISDAIAFPLTQFYLRMKGVKGTASLVANLLELIPYVGWLPLRTIGFATVVYLDHHPKLGAVTMKAASVMGKKAPAGIKEPTGERAKIIATRKEATIGKFRGGEAGTQLGDGKNNQDSGGLKEPMEEVRKTMEEVPALSEDKNSFPKPQTEEKAPVAMEDIRPAVDNREQKELL